MIARTWWIACGGILCAAMLAVAGDPVDSDSKPSTASSSARPDDKSLAMSEEIESVTLEFVREHQPELAKLLEFLKTRQKAEYRQAIAESYKVRNRLRSVKDRDGEMYEVELALWKNAAQLRLWAASVSVKNKQLTDDDRDKLRKLVTRENELTIKRLELEKARAEAKLTQVSQQLSKRQEQSESVISKVVKTWENRIERAQAKPKQKTSSTKP